MPRNEDFPNDFWDTYEELSNPAILGYAWSFTNPRAGLSGAYRCPRRDLFAGRVPEDQIDSVLDELSSYGLVYYAEKIVWVPDRAGNVHSKTEQIAKSMAKDLLAVSGSWAFWRFAEHYSAEKVPWIAQGIASRNGEQRYEIVLAALRGKAHANLVRGSESGTNEPSPEVHANPSKHVGVGVGVVGRGFSSEREHGVGRDLEEEERPDWLAEAVRS